MFAALFLSISLACCAFYCVALLRLATLFSRESGRVRQFPSAVGAAPGSAGSGFVAAGRSYPEAPREPVSIVIAARNEETSIGECLGAVSASAGPSDEIVVVDDASTDRTAAEVERIAAMDGRVRMVRLEDDPGRTAAHKKHAVAAGVAASRHAIVLQTDADCRPGRGWVHAMAAAFGEGVDFVAGPVLYAPDDTPLRAFQALEFTGLMGIAASTMKAGRPALSSGANLAFRREAFERLGGHHPASRLSSGDDVSLMHAIARGRPRAVRFCLDPDAVVETAPCATVGAFLEQRRRWASKNARVPDRSLLAGYVAIYLAFVYCLVASVGVAFSSEWVVPAAAGWLLKGTGEYAMLRVATRHFDRRRLLRWFVPSQPFHVVYVVLAPLLGTFGGFTWKHRRLRA